jgi:hypothetical protein
MVKQEKIKNNLEVLDVGGGIILKILKYGISLE